MWLFVTNTKSAWPTAFGTLVWWAWLEVVKLLAPEYGVQYHNHHNYIEWTVCHVLISLKQVPCQEVWVCPFRNIWLSVLFRHVLSSRPLGSFFSCHMHSQCVAMGAASYVKLSRAFTTSKCNFRQRTKGFNGTHSVKPSQFSRLFVLSNLFHQIEMTLPCADPLAPSTVVPMQNRR